MLSAYRQTGTTNTDTQTRCSTAHAEPNCESRARGLAPASRGYTRESRVYSRVFMHSWTRTRIPRVKPREKTRAFSTRNVPVQGRRKRMAISRATCAASDSKDPRYQAALLTRGPGTMRNYRSTVCGRGTILCIVGKELLLQRAHVSVLCRLQFTLASAALPVSSRSGFLYGRAHRAGGGCCVSSARVEYSSVASIHSSPRTRSSTRTRAPALASRARGTRE